MLNSKFFFPESLPDLSLGPIAGLTAGLFKIIKSGSGGRKSVEKVARYKLQYLENEKW